MKYSGQILEIIYFLKKETWVHKQACLLFIMYILTDAHTKSYHLRGKEEKIFLESVQENGTIANTRARAHTHAHAHTHTQKQKRRQKTHKD